MTDTEFKRLLSSPEKFSGGYLFYGDEELVKTRYAALCAEAVCGADSFSAVVLEGADTSPAQLEGALSAVPMMTERGFVHLRAAPVSQWKDKVLEDYLGVFRRAAEYEQNVYVVSVLPGEADFGTPEKNRPSALYKKLTESLTPVVFAPKGGAQLTRWVERHFLSAGLNPEYGAADALIEYSGRDMFTLSGECEKLIAYAKAHNSPEVTSAMVAEVASPDLSEEAFALANAVLEGDRPRALEALGAAKRRREEPIAVLASVSRVMSDMLAVAVYAEAGLGAKEIAGKLKMHEYKAKLYLRSAGKNTDALAASLRRCLEADTALKSTNLGYIAIERLICG